MGCQKEIVKKITDKEADYVIGLKGNQKGLQEKVKKAFSKAEISSSWIKEEEKINHGRSEEREYSLLPVPGNFNEKYIWKNFNSIGKAVSNRLLKGKLTTETRYFISSLADKSIKRFAHGVRSHWGIENSVHWQLDVSFSEDQCRKRTKNAAQNFSVLRKITLNLLKQEKTKKFGIKSKRKLAGWDEAYLEKVLSG